MTSLRPLQHFVLNQTPTFFRGRLTDRGMLLTLNMNVYVQYVAGLNKKRGAQTKQRNLRNPVEPNDISGSICNFQKGAGGGLSAAPLIPGNVVQVFGAWSMAFGSMCNISLSEFQVAR